MRLIDGNALYRKVKTECNPYGAPTINFEDGCKVLDMIKNAPTIESRTGHWIASPGMNEQCSACGKYFPVRSFIGRPFEINYCPHCGCKMEVEHD